MVVDVVLPPKGVLPRPCTTVYDDLIASKHVWVVTFRESRHVLWDVGSEECGWHCAQAKLYER